MLVPESSEHETILIKYKRKIGDLLKMGVLDKFLDIMKLSDDEDYDDDFYDEYDDDFEEKPKKSFFKKNLCKALKVLLCRLAGRVPRCKSLFDVPARPMSATTAPAM